MASVPGMRAAAVLLAATLAYAAHSADRLSVRIDGVWVDWWSADHTPAQWSAPLPLLASAVQWHPGSRGVEWGEAELSSTGEGWRTRLIVVRINPREQRFALQLAQGVAFSPSWTIESAGDTTAVAVNTEEFKHAQPWGWLVNGGTELAPRGVGPLSMAFLMDSSGGARLVPADSIAHARAGGGIAYAFQAYPTLLDGDGAVPKPLLTSGLGVDLKHRDSRVAIGELRDGRVLIAVTRLNALGDAAAKIPSGLTVPEMAALMGALGCRRAVSLDGGISGQLAVREARGTVHRWTAWRLVPLGLVVLDRPTASTVR
ncbi:MAG: phosphodiester glycosidase family protein [Gemmatimonadota bacterium]|nr:phosphodiester glycosidase family protein [Gemmatimonadota bacterium]